KSGTCAASWCRGATISRRTTCTPKRSTSTGTWARCTGCPVICSTRESTSGRRGAASWSRRSRTSRSAPRRCIGNWSYRSPSGAASVAFDRRRRHEGLVRVRTVEYFGFLLEREVEPLPEPFPPELAEAARAALRDALLAGETAHPNQARLRRALERFGFYWRRSGGQVAAAATERLAAALDAQLARVRSWQDFLDTRLDLDVDAAIPADVRAALEALPSSL